MDVAILMGVCWKRLGHALHIFEHSDVGRVESTTDSAKPVVNTTAIPKPNRAGGYNMIRTLTLALLLSTPAFAELPKSADAIDARKEYETRIKYARLAYENAVKQANKQYKIRLKKSLSLALKKQDLEESNRINAAIKATMDFATGAKSELTKKILGTVWRDTQTKTSNDDITFNSDQTLHRGRGKTRLGYWIAIDNSRVLVYYDNNKAIRLYTFSSDGKKFNYQHLEFGGSYHYGRIR